MELNGRRIPGCPWAAGASFPTCLVKVGSLPFLVLDALHLKELSGDCGTLNDSPVKRQAKQCELLSLENHP